MAILMRAGWQPPEDAVQQSGGMSFAWSDRKGRPVSALAQQMPTGRWVVHSDQETAHKYFLQDLLEMGIKP